MKKLILVIIIITLSASQSFSWINGEAEYTKEVEPKECWKAMEKGKFVGKRVNEGSTSNGGTFIYEGSYYDVYLRKSHGGKKAWFYCNKFTPKY